MTPFSSVFEIFLSQITDDLYSIFDEVETEEDLTLILKQAIPKFDFPKDPLNIDLSDKTFLRELTLEEINILANLMSEIWLSRKIRDQRVVYMEYGDKDFSLKSQASHLKVLNETLTNIKQETYTMQRMYNRRTKNGQPNYNGIAGGAN